MAALSVFGLSFGLPAFALVKVVLPAFYARQDTKTPVRAGVASLVANMVFNVVFLAILYALWVPRGSAARPGLARRWRRCRACISRWAWPARWPSYLNLALLWHWLRRAGVYERQPGWGALPAAPAAGLRRDGLRCCWSAVYLARRISPAVRGC